MTDIPKEIETEQDPKDGDETSPSAEDYFRCPYCFLQLPPAKETIEAHLLLEYTSRGISPLLIPSMPQKENVDQSLETVREVGIKNKDPQIAKHTPGRNVFDMLAGLNKNQHLPRVGDSRTEHKEFSVLLPNNAASHSLNSSSLEVAKLPIYLSMMRNFQVQQAPSTSQYNGGSRQGLFSETKQKPTVGYQQLNSAVAAPVTTAVPISSTEKQKQQYFTRQLQLMNSRLDYTPNFELFQHSAANATAAASHSSLTPKYDFNSSSQQHSAAKFDSIFVATRQLESPCVGSLLGSNYGLGLEAVNWCAHCSMSFRLTSDLVQHMRNFHRNSATANNKRLLENSAKEEISQRDNKSDSSNAGSNLTSHSAKNFKCNACGEMFKERHHLTRHLSSHTTPINRLSNGNRYSLSRKDNASVKQSISHENREESDDFIHSKISKFD